MKNSYSTSLNLQNTDFGLLLFRLIIGGLMLTHGIPKLLTFFGSEEIVFADPIGLGRLLPLHLQFLQNLYVLYL